LSTTRPSDASPAITELDGWTLDPFVPEEAPLLAKLIEHRGHRYVLDIPADPAVIGQLLAEVAKQPWSLPLAIARGDELAGFATTALPSVQALHASVAALFVDPSTARVPLAMYLRHLFWSFPLRRLHTQLPDLDLTREYVDLLTSVGFVVEGRLRDHATVGGQTFDVVALGLLRPDFEAWCAEHEPRLSLG
jgi:hypothetical protein